ncbi:hypothetical protein C9374_010550 [Naegleria lovaniensis]|uniref:TAP-C domain-containing protein n=1 Tax=Naegleria lovaniensis TaxID=51637 RepID=A0AA88GIK8_NAELO|nr:uncharacterized protein C9374_010550 [Naegleria lovaniensis]KAG2374806.1 hypothetical protein C9374_010550 [Naegleria lovaniensis]
MLTFATPTAPFASSNSFFQPPQLTQEQTTKLYMISQLSQVTGESQDKCSHYLTFFGWNLDACFQATVSFCRELCEKYGMNNVFLARRIAEEAQFNIQLCLYRMELVMKLMSQTRLIHVFAYDCLLQYQWNFDVSLKRCIELIATNRLPSHAFLSQSSPFTTTTSHPPSTLTFPSISSLTNTNTNNNNTSVPLSVMIPQTPQQQQFSQQTFSQQQQLQQTQNMYHSQPRRTTIVQRRN